MNKIKYYLRIIDNLLPEYPIILWLIDVLIFSILGILFFDKDDRKLLDILSLAIPYIATLFTINLQLQTKKEVANVSLGTYLTAEGDSIVSYPDKYSYGIVKEAGKKIIAEGWGNIREIRVAGGDLGLVTVYDGNEEIVPTVIPEKGQILKKDCTFGTNLTIETERATIITISYR